MATIQSKRTCLRCGDELAAMVAYCPSCAAPQMRITEDEIAAAAAEIGLQPPHEATASQPDWARAITACLTAGAAVGLLSSLLVYPLSGFFMIWSLGGAALAVSLYMRRTERAAMTGTLGARLGLITGCMAGAAMLAFSALFLVLQRFAFGNGWRIDNAIAQKFREMQQQMALSGAPPTNDRVLAYYNTPDWHAGLVLASACILLVLVVLFSMVGGAASGKFYAMRQRLERFRRLG